jgi:hypothetical protein
LENTYYKLSYFKCTVVAYTPCITTSDFRAKLIDKLDTIAVFRYLTVINLCDKEKNKQINKDEEKKEEEKKE